MNYKVSIVVPIYNMGSTIKSCIDSIINQDYRNLEIIIVDDGSTDNSFEICRDIASEKDNVRVYHTENRGSGPARNFGIAKATGDYIFFPDADDYMEPNTITKLIEVIKSTESDLIVFGYKSVNTIGKTIRTKIYPKIELKGSEIRKAYKPYMTTLSPLGIQGAPWNKMFNLNIIKENNIQYPSLRRHQDEGFIGRYMCYSEKVAFIPDVLYTYNVNDLAREWQKYPVDYIDSVTGLFEVRKSTILRWNKDDFETHDLVYKELICNTIKALELSFSPKMNLSTNQRFLWIKNAILKSNIQNMTIPNSAGIYHCIIHRLIKSGNYKLIYFLLLLKIQIESIMRK